MLLSFSLIFFSLSDMLHKIPNKLSIPTFAVSPSDSLQASRIRILSNLEQQLLLPALALCIILLGSLIFLE